MAIPEIHVIISTVQQAFHIDKSFNEIGKLYRDGLGVEKDDKKAADYFLKAVELGETEEAQANFDKVVEEGRIPADYTVSQDIDPLSDAGVTAVKSEE